MSDLIANEKEGGEIMDHQTKIKTKKTIRSIITAAIVIPLLLALIIDIKGTFMLLGLLLLLAVAAYAFFKIFYFAFGFLFLLVGVVAFLSITGWAFTLF